MPAKAILLPDGKRVEAEEILAEEIERLREALSRAEAERDAAVDSERSSACGLATCRAEGERAREALAASEALNEELRERVVTLTSEAEGDVALISDGKLYRGDLQAEMARLAGLIGAEREAGFILERAPNLIAAELKALCDEYRARVEEKFPPTGKGHPAAPRVVPPRDADGADAHAVI